MHQGWRHEINRIVVIAILALVTGLVTHRLVHAFLVAGFLYTCWLLYQTRKFYLWLEDNMSTPPPDAGGVWGDIFDGMYHMRQSNLKVQQGMQQQLDRVHQFTSALHSGLVLLNTQGTLNWWNRSAERLFGFKSEFDLGQPIINIVRDPGFVQFFQSGQYDQSLVIPSPVNPAVFIEIRIAIFGENEKLLSVQDITRIRQLEQMRKDFVANVSHELRTPLTVINGYLESIEDNLPSFDQEWQQPLSKISMQAKRMTDIVTDLSTLSKLDNNDVTDKDDAVPVASLINRIVEDTKQVDWGKPVAISVEGTPFTVRGSGTELQSCFSNLVYNAAKYSKAGGGHIAIRYWRDDNGGHVSVTDDGIGIDPIHIPRLTERFYRVDSSHSRKTGGTGLGLAIVKHVLLRHGGRLDIESAIGKGSTFTCHIGKERVTENSQ